MIKTISLFILSYFIIGFSHAQQNTISVKKKNTNNDIQFDGLYYSKPIIQEYKHSRKFSYNETRFYVLLFNGSKVAVFHSSLSPRKVSKKMSKNRYKMVEESGNYSKSENNLYFTVKSTESNYSKLYRYIGTMVDGYLYLNYKAAYKQKTTLDIYLYKYDNSVDL